MRLASLLALVPLLLTAQSDPASEAHKTWEQQHHTGDFKSRGQARYEASAEWTAKWPDSRLAWEQRRRSLLEIDSRSPELWKEADENLIRLSPPHTFASGAASDWVALGITLSAELAVAEGRKADAPALYQRVIADPYFHREYGGFIRETRALWDELGGTKEGWGVFAKVPPLPAGVPAGFPGQPFLPWVTVDFRLPPLEGAQFEGKTTLVYVWAATCGPCWVILPAIQKLHDAVKGQNGLQVIALSLDDDRDKVAAFMKEKGYDFPVVVSRRYVDKLFPEIPVGQMWIVNRDGAIRLQRTVNTFAGRGQALVDEALYKLSQVARAGR